MMNLVFTIGPARGKIIAEILQTISDADAGNLCISGGPFSGRGCSRNFLSSLSEHDVQQFAATAY
jgi:hypothetical protein